MITAKQLAAAYAIPLAKAQKWVDLLNGAMMKWGIVSLRDQMWFLAQVGHESGRLTYVKEIWGPTAAQLGYEGRRDLGNTKPGDGKKFMGRGLIQITGRANYKACGDALNLPLLAHPELLEEPANAADAAGWFWHANNLGACSTFKELTIKINGGTNGIADRNALLDALMKIATPDMSPKMLPTWASGTSGMGD